MIRTRVVKSAQFLANVSTIIAAFVAVFALWYGYQQFKETQKATRDTLGLQVTAIDLSQESQAVDLFIKYNEAMKETRPTAKSGDADFWRVNLALSVAEAIFKLRKGDKGWMETVGWMLSQHTDSLKKDRLNCATYDEEFIKIV